jgi:ammonia channel protein AmtB
MTSIIYPVQGYWKWGGGFLDEAGFMDFAGSGVVHLCGAAAALAGVMVLGSRRGKYKDGKPQAMPGANLPLATLGTFILWLGWFGFNGGSELIISNVAEANAVAMIFVNTNLAAAGGVMGALILAKLMFGKSDLTMALNGAIGGLVSITAEPLAPTPGLALIIGSIGGILVVFSIVFLDKMKIDDPVGAISAHGTCGVWGLMAVTLTGGTLGAQIYGTLVIFLWTFIVSLIVWSIINMIFVNTNLAAAGGVMGALILAKLMFGKSDLTMALNGAIGGLVSITAEPLAPTPGLAMLIGLIGGVLVVFSIVMLDKMKIDDPVGAISAHGTCGIWGLMAVTLTGGTLGAQIYGTLVIFLWTFIFSFIIWSIIKMMFGLRVSAEEEDEGVDLSECGLEAYPEFSKSFDGGPSVYPKK